jgi:hypothetical protein
MLVAKIHAGAMAGSVTVDATQRCNATMQRNDATQRCNATMQRLPLRPAPTGRQTVGVAE